MLDPLLRERVTNTALYCSVKSCSSEMAKSVTSGASIKRSVWDAEAGPAADKDNSSRDIDHG